MFPRRWRATTAKLIAIAKSLGVDWMLIGAAAVAKWGFPRATKDVDFTLAIGDRDSSQLDGLMERVGFSKLSGPKEIPSGLVVSQYWLDGAARDPEDGIGVDIFFTTTEWQHEAMGRRVRGSVAKGWPDFWITSKEDLVLYKIMAMRAKDIIDLEGLFERQYDAFDWRYLSFWARELSILAALEDLVSQYQAAKGMTPGIPWEDAPNGGKATS